MIDNSVLRGRFSSGASESINGRGLLKRVRSKSELSSKGVVSSGASSSTSVHAKDSVPKLDLRAVRLELLQRRGESQASVRFEDEEVGSNRRNSFQDAVESSRVVRSGIKFDVRFSDEPSTPTSPRTRDFAQRRSTAYFEDWAQVRKIFEQVLKEEIKYIFESLYRISSTDGILKLRDPNRHAFSFDKDNIKNMLDKFLRRIGRIQLDEEIRKLCDEEILKSFELNVSKVFESSLASFIENLVDKKIKCDSDVKSSHHWLVKYVFNDEDKTYKGFFNHLMTVVMGLNTMVLQTSIILGNKSEQISFEEGVSNSGFERVVINQPTAALEGFIDDEDKLNPLLKFLFERHKYFFLVDTFDKVTGGFVSSRFAQILKKSYSNLTTQMRDGGNCNILDIIKCEVEVLEYLTKRLSFKGFIIWPNEKQDNSIIKSPRAEAPLSPREEGVKIDESYTTKLRKWVEEALASKQQIIIRSQSAL